QLFRTRLFRMLLFTAWSSGFGIAIAGFFFSQTVSSGGWLEVWAAALGPRFQAIAAAFAAFVLLYPEICIGGFFTLIFWTHSLIALPLSLVALTSMVPRLVTRDRATNALTVYLSRPLTSTDYLLGKFGIIAATLALMWSGPLVFGWLLSMIFAPDRDFIVYSFTPILRALLFNAIALVSLATIALGVSAAGRTSRNTVMLWIGLWLVLGGMAAPPHAPAWVRRSSFSHNLAQVRGAVFRIENVLSDFSANLPLLTPQMTETLSITGKRVRTTDLPGALGGLGVMAALASFVFFRKLRSE
ncbi:MAG: hypothetical protein V4710_02605, partial [Verrucomicrobiota bacterium]